MTKVVYNACYGGFGLSIAAIELAREISGDPNWDACNVPRHDPVLVQVVETLILRANDECSTLCIAEVPSGALYRIDEYDGAETVETVDSYEWVVAP